MLMETTSEGLGRSYRGARPGGRRRHGWLSSPPPSRPAVGGSQLAKWLSSPPPVGGVEGGASTELTQAWLEALIDAAGSLPIRWLANPFLELHEGLIQRFPSLCVLEPSLPAYLGDFLAGFEASDTERCRTLTHAYFQRVDLLLLRRIQGSGFLAQLAPSAPSPTE
jgi:hypothetical protein